MENKKQGSPNAQKNIIIGILLAGLPILFLSNLPREAGLGLIPLLPFIFLSVVGGVLLVIRGLFLRFQPDSAKKLPLWIPLCAFALIIILSVYFIPGALDAIKYNFQKNKAIAPVQVAPVVSNQVTLSTKTQVPPIATVVSDNTVTVKEWGISFMLPAGFQLAAKNPYPRSGDTATANQVFLCNDECGDWITIDYIQDSKVTTTDAKFGDMTFFYDTAKRQWIRKAYVSDGSGVAVMLPDSPASKYSDGGLPIFAATGRWMTYVVPLSPNQALRLNITGGGITQPLTDLVKTLKKL